MEVRVGPSPLVALLSIRLGLRPFGVSLLYAGYDPHYKFQLYHSDPSGNYSVWKATCIGANSGTAQSLLKQEYKDDISIDDAIALVLSAGAVVAQQDLVKQNQATMKGNGRAIGGLVAMVKGEKPYDQPTVDEAVKQLHLAQLNKQRESMDKLFFDCSQRYWVMFRDKPFSEELCSLHRSMYKAGQKMDQARDVVVRAYHYMEEDVVNREFSVQDATYTEMRRLFSSVAKRIRTRNIETVPLVI